MGSACQKPPDDRSYYQETEEIQQDDFIIEQEQYPLKIHKGGRKALHKSKRLQQEIESDDISQEPVIQSDDQINQMQIYKTYHQKSTYQSTEKNRIPQEKQKQLISIMKQKFSQKLTQSSLQVLSTTNSKLQQSSIKIKDQQEKHVRFKLPKSHKQKQRTHSNFRNRLNTQVYNYL
ncbi:unnamed protein product [Paramecium pentaurelia]|uniref:Uncharacterized protein n=1 Tax=Paramecium pentaurelia TaxID=43138 RepID=A0A8S1TSL0_9CILI|nr:unnamed protein product [Paramecium pentaurelia]